MSAGFTGAAVAILVAIGAALVWIRYPRFARRKRFSRLALTLDGFYSRYYAASGIPFEVVDRAIIVLGERLDVDPRLLYPEDRFDGILRAPCGWEFDDGLTILSQDLTSAASIAGKQIRLDQINTVDDYIREFAASSNLLPSSKEGG